LCGALGEQGCSFVRENYTWELAVEKYLRILSAVAADRSGAPRLAGQCDPARLLAQQSRLEVRGLQAANFPEPTVQDEEMTSSRPGTRPSAG